MDSFRDRHGMVQPPVIEETIKADHGAAFWIGGAEDDPSDPCLKDRPGTHQAGFEGYIESRPGEAIISEDSGRTPDGKNLRMGRRVVKGDGTVMRQIGRAHV